MKPVHGQSVIIRDPETGNWVRVDSRNRLHVSGDVEVTNMPTTILYSGDIQIGALEIKDGVTDDRANVHQGVSGDYGVGTVEQEVTPLHKSKTNPTLSLQYNTSGDLIFIDKFINGTVFRKPVWKEDYTGDGNIDATKVWVFGAFEEL